MAINVYSTDSEAESYCSLSYPGSSKARGTARVLSSHPLLHPFLNPAQASRALPQPMHTRG